MWHVFHANLYFMLEFTKIPPVKDKAACESTCSYSDTVYYSSDPSSVAHCKYLIEFGGSYHLLNAYFDITGNMLGTLMLILVLHRRQWNRASKFFFFISHVSILLGTH